MDGSVLLVNSIAPRDGGAFRGRRGPVVVSMQVVLVGLAWDVALLIHVAALLRTVLNVLQTHFDRREVYLSAPLLL